MRLTSPNGTTVEVADAQAKKLKRLGYTTAQPPKPRKSRKPKAEPKQDD